MFHQDDLSRAVISAHFYTYLRGMFLVYIPMYSTIWEKIDQSIFRTAWCLLHHSVWVYGGILVHPLCCIFFLKLYTRSLHRLPIGAPGLLIPGCVSWFFESVVGQILDTGCWLKTVIGFEFYSPGCISYPGCLQLVTMLCFQLVILSNISLMSWRSGLHPYQSASIRVDVVNLFAGRVETCCTFFALTVLEWSWTFVLICCFPLLIQLTKVWHLRSAELSEFFV
jgi:hypothetical protein